MTKKEYKAQYYLLHKEKIKKQMADYYSAHREERKNYSNLYYLENKEQIRRNEKVYRNTRKKELNVYHKRYNTERRENDTLFKVVSNLRSRTSQAFKRIGLNKPTKTETLLGADYKTVMRHIESQFIFGMSWEKVGSEIHIDHKTPLATAKTEKQLMKLCRYTNLQPLWAEDNMSKHDNLNYTTNNLSPSGNC